MRLDLTARNKSIHINVEFKPVTQSMFYTPNSVTKNSVLTLAIHWIYSNYMLIQSSTPQNYNNKINILHIKVTIKS